MAIVVFLRGVNVGGHRRFRPALLARALSAYGVVNVGAAGTLSFASRDPAPGSGPCCAASSRSKRKSWCARGRDLIRLEAENPFGAEALRRDVVRFALGVYRRHMKTIGYLGGIDNLFGVPVTTRNWNTIVAIARIVRAR